MRQSHLTQIIKMIICLTVFGFVAANTFMYFNYVSTTAFILLPPINLMAALIGWPVVVLLLSYIILDATYRW